MTTKEQNTFMMGGFLAVLGLYSVAFSHSLDTGFLLLGLGVVVMASTSKEYSKELFEFFLSVLQGLWDLVSNL